MGQKYVSQGMMGCQLNVKRLCYLFCIISFLPYTTAGDHSSGCSPRPIRASLVSSSSTSSFRRALSSTRTALSISPVIPPAEPAKFHNGQRSNAPCSPQNQHLERDLHLEPFSMNLEQDSAEDDPLDMQEVCFFLCILFIINTVWLKSCEPYTLFHSTAV